MAQSLRVSRLFATSNVKVVLLHHVILPLFISSHFQRRDNSRPGDKQMSFQMVLIKNINDINDTHGMPDLKTAFDEGPLEMTEPR